MSHDKLFRYINGDITSSTRKRIPLTSLFTALLALYGKQQAPVWLRTACGSYLSEALSRDNGVSALLRVFLSRSAAKAGSAGAGTSHLDEGTVAAISRILLSPPKHDSKQKDYFENLTRQLRALLLSDQPAMASVSGTLCLQLLYKRPEAGQRLIVDPILQPIMSLVWTKDLQPGASSSSDVDLDGNPILVTEEDLESRLIQLQCLLVEAKASTILTRLLAPAVPSLYFLYQFVSSGTSGLKTALQDLMTLLFRVAEEAVALDFLKSLAMVPTIDTINMVNGPSGGVALSWSSSPIQCAFFSVSLYILHSLTCACSDGNSTWTYS